MNCPSSNAMLSGCTFTIEVLATVTLLICGCGRGANNDRTETTSPGESERSQPSVHPPLSEEKQQYIWDTEHITFEIETYVGKPFAHAVLHQDAKRLDDYLTPSFSSTWMSTDNPETIEKSGITQKKWSRSNNAEESVHRSRFANRVLLRPKVIHAPAASRLRVLHISSVNSDASAGLWKLDVLLTAAGRDIENRSVEYEQTADVVCQFASDDEIRAGQIFSEWNVTSEVIRVSSTFMEEVTDRYDINKEGMHDNWTASERFQEYTRQIAVEDFNNDGYQDLIVAEATGRTWLFQSDSGQKFIDVTSKVGLPKLTPYGGKNCLVSWIDVDNDGFSDLLLGSALYRNLDGTRFQNITARSRLQIRDNPMSCAVADYDCDGKVDLYVLYQNSPENRPTETIGWVGDDDSGGENELWRNTGDGVFENVTQSCGVAGGFRHSFAAAWLFGNDDHYPDLYVANDFARNAFFLNNGDGTFQDVSEASRTADFATSMGVATGDIDGDGNPEIYVANMYSKMGRRIIGQVDEHDYGAGVYNQIKGSCAGNRLYRLSDDGETWEEVSEQAGVNGVGWAHAPALADFDLDGSLDIYSTAGFISRTRGKPDG